MEQASLMQLIDEIQVLGGLIEQTRQSVDRMRYLMEDLGSDEVPPAESLELPLRRAWDSLIEAMNEANRMKEAIEEKEWEESQKALEEMPEKAKKTLDILP